MYILKTKNMTKIVEQITKQKAEAYLSLIDFDRTTNDEEITIELDGYSLYLHVNYHFSSLVNHGSYMEEDECYTELTFIEYLGFELTTNNGETLIQLTKEEEKQIFNSITFIL